MFGKIVLVFLASAGVLLSACSQPAVVPTANDADEAAREAGFDVGQYLNVRRSVVPLPGPGEFASAIVEGREDFENGRAFLGRARMDSQVIDAARLTPNLVTRIYPPLNADTLTLTIMLEPDSWTRRDEVQADGVGYLIESLSANGETLVRFTGEVEPSEETALGDGYTFDVPLASDMSTLKLTFDNNGNAAYDSFFLIGIFGAASSQ